MQIFPVASVCSVTNLSVSIKNFLKIPSTVNSVSHGFLHDLFLSVGEI